MTLALIVRLYKDLQSLSRKLYKYHLRNNTEKYAKNKLLFTPGAIWAKVSVLVK